jgi:hypothetical protein
MFAFEHDPRCNCSRMNARPDFGRIAFNVSLVILPFGTLLVCAAPTPSPKPARGTIEYAKTHVLYAAKPHYPLESRARLWTGTGLFLLIVRPDGTVSDVQVLKSTGHEILDDEARSTY